MKQETSIHIAIADDHAIIRDGITSMLKKMSGIVVDIEAADGEELIERLKETTVLPQICIIDINMPVMDGYTTLMEIRKHWPKMKTLVFTGIQQEYAVIRMILAGANGYLLKGCKVEAIRDALIAIHKEGYYYSECANSTLFHLVTTGAVKIPSFSANEIGVLKLCCTELTYRQIGNKLNLSLRGVDSARDRLCRKLTLKTRTELVLFAIRAGVVII